MTDDGIEAGIGELRAEIEAIDTELVELLARRVEVAREIGLAKRGGGAATLDPGREAAVIRRAVEAARERGLAEEPVRDLFWTIVGLCRAAQLEER